MDDSNSLRRAPSNTSTSSQYSREKEEYMIVRVSTQTTIGMPAPPSKPLHISKARKIYLVALIWGLVMLTFIIFGIFSIFWGSLYRIGTNTHKMVGWVVDFDNGPVGSAVTSAVERLPYSPTTMTWVIKSASDFPGGPEDLAGSVHQEHVWFAVSVNPGASDALAAALASPEQHSNYSGSIAVTGYGEEARSENGFRQVLRPQFDLLMQPIVSDFAAQFVAQNYSALTQEQTAAVLQFTPQLMSRPIYYTLTNLRPFDVPVGTAVVFVGMIFLLVMSFMVAMVSLGGRLISGLEFHLLRWKLVILRFTTDFVVYFFLSLFYGLVSVAFQVPFDRHMGKGGFMVYWMLQWVGMLALGYALETMMILLTPRFMPLFLLLWIVTDCAVVLFPIDLLPGIFRFGYAMPFYNIAQGIRTILFGTKAHFGVNFGSLIAWIVVSAVTMPLSMRFVVWNEARKRAKAEAKEAAEEAKAQVFRSVSQT